MTAIPAADCFLLVRIHVFHCINSTSKPMLLFVICSSFIFSDNLLYVKNILYSATEQTILNATYSVDTFFVLRFVILQQIIVFEKKLNYFSGCLLCFLWLKDTQKKAAKNLTSATNWIVYYVSRFIR